MQPTVVTMRKRTIGLITHLLPPKEMGGWACGPYTTRGKLWSRPTPFGGAGEGNDAFNNQYRLSHNGRLASRPGPVVSLHVALLFVLGR